MTLPEIQRALALLVENLPGAVDINSIDLKLQDNNEVGSFVGIKFIEYHEQENVAVLIPEK